MQLFIIVRHSTRTDKEVMLCELATNVSDALEKWRHLQESIIEEHEVLGDDFTLEIRFESDHRQSRSGHFFE
jgi:HSP90 family molecular chaperone